VNQTELPSLVEGLRDLMLLSARDVCYVPLAQAEHEDHQAQQTPYHVHAVLQGAFSETAIRSAQVAEYSDTPILAFGATADELSDKVRLDWSCAYSRSITLVNNSGNKSHTSYVDSFLSLPQSDPNERALFQGAIPDL
jgi:hypothetical protein